MSREAPGKEASYASGGWRSKARQKSRPEVREAVQLAARGGLGTDGPAPGGDAKLLAAYVGPLRGSFKANQGKDGRWWYKVSWPEATGQVYLAVSYDEPVVTYAALVDLCQLIEEVRRGLRRPSPDRWGQRG